jgi:hypothetical protein
VVDDTVGPALRERHVERVEHQLGLSLDAAKDGLASRRALDGISRDL